MPSIDWRNTMFKCINCKEIFLEPITIKEKTDVRSEHFDEVLHYGSCPECGCDEYYELPACMICGKTGEMYDVDVCMDCHEDMKGLIMVAFSQFEKMHPKAKDDDMYWMLYQIWDDWDNGHSGDK